MYYRNLTKSTTRSNLEIAIFKTFLAYTLNCLKIQIVLIFFLTVHYKIFILIKQGLHVHNSYSLILVPPACFLLKLLPDLNHFSKIASKFNVATLTYVSKIPSSRPHYSPYSSPLYLHFVTQALSFFTLTFWAIMAIPLP